MPATPVKRAALLVGNGQEQKLEPIVKYIEHKPSEHTGRGKAWIARHSAFVKYPQISPQHRAVTPAKMSGKAAINHFQA